MGKSFALNVRFKYLFFYFVKFKIPDDRVKNNIQKIQEILQILKI